MENIIKKAIEGGYMKGKEISDVSKYGSFWLTNGKGIKDLVIKEQTVLDPLFWQALSKACGWVNNTRKPEWRMLDGELASIIIVSENSWYIHAIRFHEINLTQNWERAVEYLEEVIN